MLSSFGRCVHTGFDYQNAEAMNSCGQEKSSSDFMIAVFKQFYEIMDPLNWQDGADAWMCEARDRDSNLVACWQTFISPGQGAVVQGYPLEWNWTEILVQLRILNCTKICHVTVRVDYTWNLLCSHPWKGVGPEFRSRQFFLRFFWKVDSENLMRCECSMSWLRNF